MKTKITRHSLRQIYADIENELIEACNKFQAYNSGHEGYAVIKEELDELWDEIKNEHDKVRMYNESKQVASTAIRFMLDICINSENPTGELY